MNQIKRQASTEYSPWENSTEQEGAMPAVRLWGRRWHFSSDVVPIPAAICGLFHAIWISFLLFGAIATGDWPSDCESRTGKQYMAVFIGLFGSFVISLVLEVLLFVHGLRGKQELKVNI